MNKKNFFQQLKTELHDHPYRDRFLEELEDHAEDLEKETLDKENWAKRMSDPKSIKKTFMSIMNPLGKLFFVLEGLFYGFLTAPAALIFFTVNKWQQIDPSMNQSRMIIGTMLSAVFIALIFYLSFKCYQKIKSSTDFSPKFWALLILIPSLISLGFLTFFGFSHQDSYKIDAPEAFLMMGIYFLINLAAAFLGWFFTKNSGPNKKKKRFFEFVKKALLIYVATGLIFKTIFTYLVHSEPSTGIMILMAPFLPIMSIEYMFVFFWTGMMNFSPQGDVNLFTTYYFLIFILIFLGLQSFLVMLKEKKWFSFRGLMVLYVLTLVAIPGKPGVAEPEFKVPAINISEFIEKKELGVFYGIIKYFNQDEGLIFKYEVGLDSQDALAIKSNTGKMYYLSKEFIDSPTPITPTFENIFDGVMEVGKDDSLHGINLPKFPCKKTEQEECNLNSYINRYILNSSVPASDGYFSTDGKWGLISIPSAAYDPDSVYLVKIK